MGQGNSGGTQTQLSLVERMYLCFSFSHGARSFFLFKTAEVGSLRPTSLKNIRQGRGLGFLYLQRQGEFPKGGPLVGEGVLLEEPYEDQRGLGIYRGGSADEKGSMWDARIRPEWCLLLQPLCSVPPPASVLHPSHTLTPNLMRFTRVN